MKIDDDLEIDEEDLMRDINQADKIDSETVERQLGEMGFLYDTVIKKLNGDSICFNCKKEINIKNEALKVKEASKVERGVVAFVALCEACETELSKKQ